MRVTGRLGRAKKSEKVGKGVQLEELKGAQLGKDRTGPFTKERAHLCRARWCTPMAPASWEAEAGELPPVPDQPGQLSGTVLVPQVL